jgi:hypothetical protein
VDFGVSNFYEVEVKVEKINSLPSALSLNPTILKMRGKQERWQKNNFF